MPPKESPVPGLPLINPTTLAPEFRRFRNDALYFIQNIMYEPMVTDGDKSDEKKKSEKKPEPKSRILAVTPQAIFVCDPLGSMDRAVRIENIELFKFQHNTVKKIFRSEKVIRCLVRCTNEMDIVFLFDSSAGETAVKNIRRVLETAVNFKNDNDAFKSEEVPTGEKLEDQIKADKPADYLSPKDIIAQNQARARLIEAMDAINRDILELQEKITARTRARDDKRHELSSLQAAMGGDVKERMAKKEQLQAEHSRLHRSHMDAEVEMMRVQTELRNEQARLEEERANGDMLLEQSLKAANADADKEFAESNAVLKRDHERKLAKATKHLDALKAKVTAPPQYNGPAGLVQRAQDLEQKVQQAADKWEKEMVMANKFEGYFDAAISDLQVVNEQIALMMDRKKQLIAAREERLKPAAAPAAAASALDDDDDLLGGGGGAANPSPAKAAAIDDDDDDLLGGGGPAPAAAKPAAPPADDDDDDLLGGGGGGGAAPAPAAAAAAAPPAGGDDDDDDGLL